MEKYRFRTTPIKPSLEKIFLRDLSKGTTRKLTFPAKSHNHQIARVLRTGNVLDMWNR